MHKKYHITKCHMKTILLSLFILFIYHNNDGALSNTWSAYLLGREIRDIAISDNDVWCAAHLDGLYRLNRYDAATTYHITADSLDSDMVSAVEIDKEGILWVGTKDGIRSFDGISWTDYPESRVSEQVVKKASHLIEIDYDDYITCIAVDNSGGKWFGYYVQIVHFYNGEWETYNSTNTDFLDSFIYEITVDSLGRVWVGTAYDGVNYYYNDIWTTTMQDMRTLLFQSVLSICEDKNGIIWFGGPSGQAAIFNGVSYTEYPDFIDVQLKQDVSAGAADLNNVIWFGANDGVSRYNGNSWENYMEVCGLPLSEIKDIEVDKDNNKWFATNNGIRLLNDSPTSVNTQSFKFIFYESFPNPFNLQTTIEYSLPHNTHTTLTIYSITGQAVIVLKNEYQQAGNHSVTWNAAGMPSGLYFCTLKADGRSETRKMVVVR